MSRSARDLAFARRTRLAPTKCTHRSRAWRQHGRRTAGGRPWTQRRLSNPDLPPAPVLPPGRRWRRGICHAAFPCKPRAVRRPGSPLAEPPARLRTRPTPAAGLVTCPVNSSRRSEPAGPRTRTPLPARKNKARDDIRHAPTPADTGVSPRQLCDASLRCGARRHVASVRQVDDGALTRNVCKHGVDVVRHGPRREMGEGTLAG